MKASKLFRFLIVSLVCVTVVPATQAQSEAKVRANYNKLERMIPMRDGIKLFTSIYTPKDTSQQYPIMLFRTPYSVSPYGSDRYRESLGPSPLFQDERYIFVYQDVRGKLMSEGEYENVRPHKPTKSGPKDIDESTDTYDTIEWLLKNLTNHNGRVGMWGISYPGFYVSTGIIDAHPALKAASPQAPIADWFIGDDFHHNGALFLVHTFNFFATFGLPRPKPTTEFPPRFRHDNPDGYQFFLDLGPLPEADKRHFKGQVSFWNEILDHPNYDEFWKARNILPHLKNIKPAVMTVGGWFDAEDLYGPLKTYEAIEKSSKGAYNILVMGPWFHGGWARSDGDFLGSVTFGSKTSVYYREHVELPFFNCLLKDKCVQKLPEALVFETGSNQWKRYDQWPPANTQKRALYLAGDGKLAFAPAAETVGAGGFDEYFSDPNKPVPYINGIANGMTSEYMVDDQRFAATRPDVLVYESEVLSQPLTVAGPITATLYVSTTGTDSDFIVKLIDVFPNDAPDSSSNEATMGGYQMLVRGEPMRARFRNSFEKPEGLTPNEVTKVEFTLPDVNHTFLKGHKLMVQIQSSWFPLVDRNPQKFVDIYKATAGDFQKATQRVYRSRQYPSHATLNVLR